MWHDGVVTTAFKNGEWVLLDNLSQAEASVLERLNPIVCFLHQLNTRTRVRCEAFLFCQKHCTPAKVFWI